MKGRLGRLGRMAVMGRPSLLGKAEKQGVSGMGWNLRFWGFVRGVSVGFIVSQSVNYGSLKLLNIGTV